LDQRVRDRTHELEKRARYLEATSVVFGEASAFLNVEELLIRVAPLISDVFGFYHTGLFLLDELAEWAVLRSVSSAGGKRMLERGHRVRVGKTGVVSWVADHGEHRIALDMSPDSINSHYTDLPETRSEMALPMRARGRIIGVLDVHSTEPGAFGPQDVRVLQPLADQVALAIDNARLFERAEAALLSERRVQETGLREGWHDLLRATGDVGFVSDDHGTTTMNDEWGEWMVTALHSGEMVSSSSDQRALAVPIKVRGQTVGVVDAYQPGGERDWTPEQRDLLQALADQLSLALESAQLYDGAQRAAAREQLTARITQRIREALDVEDILRIASTALGQELEAHDVVVRLGTERTLVRGGSE
jgi:GAF domain-containing protein